MHETLINEHGVVTHRSVQPAKVDPQELGQWEMLMLYALYGQLALGVVIMSLIIRLVVG